MIIWSFLKSKKLSLALIALVSLAIIGDNLLSFMAAPATPQKSTIYNYFWFKILVLLLLINLTACTVNGIIQRIRVRSRDIGRWGSTLFHLGLIILLAGSFITGISRIWGRTKIIEGQKKYIPYQEMTENFILSNRHYPGFFITFTDFKEEFNKTGGLERVSSRAQLLEGEKIVSEHTLPSTDTMVYQDIKVEQLNAGWAALLSLAEPGGTKETQLSLPMENGTVQYGSINFRMDDYQPENLPFLLSLNLNRYQGTTSLDITVKEKNGTIVGNKVLQSGDKINFNGYRLTFNEVRPWVEFQLLYDPGVHFVFTGGALAVTGLSLLFLSRGFLKPQKKQG